MKNNIRPIDIAKRLNVSTSTLRSYETRGIIQPQKGWIQDIESIRRNI
ncbi:MerR family DNA-binding transcriptional regulator [Bacillus sp. Xin]|nr:MerR family DNA-binding transcriptional regulator [Bacillus sp. Xin]NSW39441.1 MerR family DNA-binding transcriptional regulator [Bacillus sp. Xin1]